MTFKQEVKRFSCPKELEAAYEGLKERAKGLGFEQELWPDLIAAMLKEVETLRISLSEAI